MTRVLWVMPYFEVFGGAERVTLDVTGVLAREFAVTLLLLKPGIIHNYTLGSGVQLETLLSDQTRLRWHLPQVVNALLRKARQHDVIVAGLELGPTYLSAIMASLARRPCIAMCHITLHDYLTAAGLPQYHWTLSRFAYRRVQRVIGVGKAVTDHLHSRFGVSTDRLQTIYNPLDLVRLRKLADEPPEWLPPVERFALGIGRLEKQKGFDVLLKAMAKLQPEEQIHLVILGEGSQRAELMRLVESLGLSELVHLPGFLKNPYPVLSRAHALAFPSRYEGFGLAVVEAMALGVPVIASDIAVVRETTDDGRCALLVPTEDPEALAQGLGEVLSNLELRDQLIKEGINQAKNFDIQRIAGQWRNLINEVCR